MKSISAALAIPIIVFVLLFLLVPMKYKYSIPWSCASTPGVHSCPNVDIRHDGQPRSLITDRGPVIVNFHKTDFRLVDNKKTVLIEVAIAVIAGLLAYEAADLRDRKQSNKK